MSEEVKQAEDRPVEGDVLDDLRRIESLNRRRLFAKKLKELKELSHDVASKKAEVEMILKGIGVKDKDIKRVIDFVNELEEVKMNEDELKALKAKVSKKISSEMSEVEETVAKDVLTRPQTGGMSGNIEIWGYSPPPHLHLTQKIYGSQKTMRSPNFSNPNVVYCNGNSSSGALVAGNSNSSLTNLVGSEGKSLSLQL
jgi:hypothetical protein